MSARSAKRMKLLLPIKTAQGRLVVQSREEEIEDQKAEIIDEAAESDAGSHTSKPDENDFLSGSEPDNEQPDFGNDDESANKELTPVEQMALEESKAKELKITIANHAHCVIDNPQENVGHLRKLRLLLANPLCQARPVLADYVVVSLCEVFKDILPSYKIRLATDAEKSQQAKKETKRLRAFEETLLLNYRKYLALLRQAMRKPNATTDSRGQAKNNKISGWRKKRKRAAQKEEENAIYSNRNVTVRCLSQLLAAHPNFNESSELIAWLTPCLQSRSTDISGPACSAFRQLFVEDRSGEATLRAVKSVCRVAVAAGAKVHADLLDVLASVRVDLPPPAEAASDKPLTHQQKLAKLSRRQRRQDKRTAVDRRGLEELRHQESVNVRARLQQRCAELLLHLYLRVLRAKPSARALTAALAGLGRLALRVNLDMLPDLFAALAGLLDWPGLSAAHSVEVVRTALALLSGEGEALTLDPRRFYVHLYKRLDRLVRSHPDLAPSLSQTLVEALAGRRRHLPPMRPVNFLRRLVDSICQTALGSSSPAVESSLVCLLRCSARLFAVFPRSQRLLEPADLDDDQDGTAGPLLGPIVDIDDPDLGGLSCHTCEPALRRLTTNDKVSPAIRQLFGQLLKQNFVALDSSIAASGPRLGKPDANDDGSDNEEENPQKNRKFPNKKPRKNFKGGSKIKKSAGSKRKEARGR